MVQFWSSPRVLVVCLSGEDLKITNFVFFELDRSVSRGDFELKPPSALVKIAYVAIASLGGILFLSPRVLWLRSRRR